MIEILIKTMLSFGGVGVILLISICFNMPFKDGKEQCWVDGVMFWIVWITTVLAMVVWLMTVWEVR